MAKKKAKAAVSDDASEGAEESTTAVKKSKKAVTFDLLTPEGMAYRQEATSSYLAVQASKTRRNLAVRSLNDIRRSFFPIWQLHWQHMTKCLGLPKEGLVEIYGPPGAGKTSLVFWLINQIVRNDRCPVLYINTEPKPMDRLRARRFFGSNIKEAEQIMAAVDFQDARSLSEMDDSLWAWVNIWRGGHAKSKFALDRKTVPLVVVIDTLSMLLPPGEEKGFYDFAQNMYEQNKKAFKQTGSSSNLEFSKFMAAFIRRLNTLQTSHGVTVIIVHHPNEEIDMSGGSRFKIPESPLSKALRNTVSIGGKASKRLSALQLVLTPTGTAIRDPKTKEISGKQIIIKPAKNSDGPTTRSIMYELREEHAAHDAFDNNYQDPGLHFEEKTAQWMSEHGHLGTKSEAGGYTCPRLGLSKVTAEVLCEELHANRELVEELGKKLGILGYEAQQSDEELLKALTSEQQEEIQTEEEADGIEEQQVLNEGEDDINED